MTPPPGVPSPPSSATAAHAGDGKHATPPATCPDDGLSAFLCARPRLFGIAYRMLGRAAEAEDIVQDVWVRWQTTDQGPVRNPPAFLVAATTRLAINVLQSARARRETCVGPWLPEPVDSGADPELGVERGEALSHAVLVLVEKLLPTERAAYVLREAFNYPYREIAEIIRVKEANARQLVARAREHVSGGPRATVSPSAHRHLLSAFVAAARTGDLARLERVVVADIAATRPFAAVVCHNRSPFPVYGSQTRRMQVSTPAGALEEQR